MIYLTKYKPKGSSHFTSFSEGYFDEVVPVIGAYGHLVLSCIARHEKDEKHFSMTSISFIAKQTGISENTVIKSLKQLKSLHLIKKVEERNSKGELTKYGYTVVVHSDVEDYKKFILGGTASPASPPCTTESTPPCTTWVHSEELTPQASPSVLKKEAEEEAPNPSLRVVDLKLVRQAEQKKKDLARIREELSIELSAQEIVGKSVHNPNVTKSYVYRDSGLPDNYLIDDDLPTDLADLQKRVVFLTATNRICMAMQDLKHEDRYSLTSKSDIEKFGDVVCGFTVAYDQDWPFRFEQFCRWAFQYRDGWAPGLLGCYHNDWLSAVRIPANRRSS